MKMRIAVCSVLTLVVLCLTNRLFLSAGKIKFTLQTGASAAVSVEFRSSGDIRTEQSVADENGQTDFNINARVLTDIVFKSSAPISLIKVASLKKHIVSSNGKTVQIKRVFGKIKLNFLVLISIASVSFLFLYKISGLFSDVDKTDLVFVCLFTLSLFVPMMKIDTAKKSVTENRTLAEPPTLITDRGLNKRFGNDFDSWFNDRFFGRRELIRLFGKIGAAGQQDTGRESDNALIGKEKWIFLKSDNSVLNYQNAISFSDKELSRITAYLQGVKQYAEQNGKKFVFFIAPDKNKIYGEFYSPKIRKIKSDEDNMTFQLIRHLKQSGITAVYPAQTLREHKKSGLLYYKNDTHWNDFGAYIGFRRLIENAGVACPLNVSFTDKAHPVGDLNAMISIPDNWYNDVLYKTHSLDVSGIVKTNGDERKGASFHNKNGRLNVVSLRDSFSSALLPYYARCFKNGYFFWRYQFQNGDQSTVAAADVIVIETVERYLPQLAKQEIPSFMTEK